MILFETVLVSFLLLFVCMFYCLTRWMHWQRFPAAAFYILLCAFLIRVLFVIVDHHVGMFAGNAHGDWRAFDSSLVYVADGLREGNILAGWELSEGIYTGSMKGVLFGYVYGPIYAIFGHHPVLVRLAIAFTGTLFVVNLYRIGREITTPRAGIYAAAFGAVFPIFVEQSGVILREVLVLFLLSETLYLLFRWLDTERPETFMLAVIVAMLAISPRFENVVPLGAAFGVAIFWRYEDHPLRIPAFIFVVVVTIAVVLSQVADSIGLAVFAEQHRAVTHGEAAFLRNVTYETWFEFIAYLPIGIIYFLFVPFPWHAINELAIVSIYQNIVLWYPIAILSIYGIKVAWQENPQFTSLLIAYLIIGLVIYGATVGNLGQVIRWRMQFQFILILFGSIYLADRVHIRATRDHLSNNSTASDTDSTEKAKRLT